MRDDNYSEEEKNAIQMAVSTAYRKLDSIITKENNRYSINWGMINSFINLFARNQTGFFFTINQDLFIERFRKDGNCPSPGVNPIKERRLSNNLAPLEEIGYCNCPKKEEIDKDEEEYLLKSNFFYIKLHGSQDWMNISGRNITKNSDSLSL